jgi:hypothetical protein
MDVTIAPSDFVDRTEEQTYNFQLIDNPAYIENGTDGLVRIRFNHVSGGNQNYLFHIDHMYLERVRVGRKLIMDITTGKLYRQVEDWLYQPL